MVITVCCDGSKNLEWSILITNCMLIFFFTAAKAIQLYLIGTTSRFLMFNRRRIYSCKKQNKAKNSQTAHAGMATSPTATAHQNHSQLISHWDTQWMLLLTKLYNEFCFVLMQRPNADSGYNVTDFLETYFNDMCERGWKFQLSILQHCCRCTFYRP